MNIVFYSWTAEKGW